MNLLGSILPGLRDVRAPIAAGYLWLLDLWLLFGDRVPSRAEASGVVEKIYALDAVVSQVGLGVAITFAAYLIGAVSESLTSAVLKYLQTVVSPIPRRYSRVLLGMGLDVLRKARPNKEDLNQLVSEFSDSDRTIRFNTMSDDERFRSTVVLSYGRRTGILDLGDWVSELLDAGSETFDEESVETASYTSRDMNLVRARLMTEQTALYGEYDRLESEAEFRAAVIPPLSFLALTIAVVENALWGLALVPLIVLANDAFRRLRRADEALQQAVESGKVKSPLLESFERELSARTGAKVLEGQVAQVQVEESDK